MQRGSGWMLSSTFGSRFHGNAYPSDWLIQRGLLFRIMGSVGFPLGIWHFIIVYLKC